MARRYIVLGPNIREVDEKTLGDLRASIEKDGILQPLIVTPRGGRSRKFVLVAGGRRFAASVGILDELPVMVHEDLDPADRVAVQAIENLLREDLTRTEEARAYDELRSTGQEVPAIADRFGFPRFRVERHLRLLTLPVGVQKLVDAGSVGLDAIKHIEKVPEASTRGRVEVAKLIAGGSDPDKAPWSYAAILIETKPPFDMTPCLDCPKKKAMVVPKEEWQRFNWLGKEPRKGGVPAIACFDDSCRKKKESTGKATTRRGLLKKLREKITARVQKIAIAEEKKPCLDRWGVSNVEEDLRALRKSKRQDQWYPHPGDEEDLKQLEGPFPFRMECTYETKAKADAAGIDERLVATHCQTCPAHAIVVDGFLTWDEKMSVSAHRACMNPGKRGQERESETRRQYAQELLVEEGLVVELREDLVPSVVTNTESSARFLGETLHHHSAPHSKVVRRLILAEPCPEDDEAAIDEWEKRFKEAAHLAFSERPRELLVGVLLAERYIFQLEEAAAFLGKVISPPAPKKEPAKKKGKKK